MLVIQSTGMDESTTSSRKHGHQFLVTWDKAILLLQNGSPLTIPYNSLTYLPVLTAYKKAFTVAQGMGLKGCVTSESNQHLSFWSKWLSRWHFKLGHLGFAHTQWIGRHNILGAATTTWGSTKITPPKCAACQFGKQQHKPLKTKNTQPILVNKESSRGISYNQES